MSLHPAVQSLCEQPVDGIGLTAVSAVASALSDISVAADLIQRPEHAKALQDVLRKCMSLLNNGSKNFALRLACLECLYALSQPPIPAFRSGLLSHTLHTMTGSVEEMLARSGPSAAEGLSSAREMLTALIFRFTSYNTKACRLLLQHTCDGDVGAMVQTLVRVMVHHRERCEWPLLLAALQTLYELTVPATYYATGDGGADAVDAPATDSSLQSFTVESFQDRISALLTELRERRVLEQLLASLRLSWHESTYNRSAPSLAQGYAESVALGALGRPDVVHTVAAASAEQQMELLNWLSAFTLLCRALDNMVEFSRDATAAREVRSRLLGDPSCHDWLASAAVPAVAAAVHVWASNSSSSGGGGAYATPTVRHTLLSAAVTLLRLLRFALYRPAVGFTPALLSSMARLAGVVRRAEPRLREQYSGMQVVLLTVECLVNMDAATVTGAVNLAEAYVDLISTVAADTTHCGLSDSYSADATAAPPAPPTTTMTAAGWVALCVREEESPFCDLDSGSASVALLHQHLAAEEALLQDTADRVADLVALESQLAMLQNFLLLMTLSELLSGLPQRGLEQLAQARPCSSASAPRQLPPAPSPSRGGGGGAKRPKARKAKASPHPAAYVCDLTGKLMREPVVLKNGHRFEYDALQRIIEQVGHVDPVSGESIDEDVEPDIPLQQEIAAYRVTRAAEKSAGG
ncbi:U-box domain containing protein [Novymonas esmeraldas]|uniref:U-box domain containing protein n=1 Tax=Novymonas esmeraldas TaxID=1808958 RepID=A0AAW0ENC1_9TRYP